ncbi:unnamed protein product, partial [Mesorhabditis spiculigera]
MDALDFTTGLLESTPEFTLFFHLPATTQHQILGNLPLRDYFRFASSSWRSWRLAKELPLQKWDHDKSSERQGQEEATKSELKTPWYRLLPPETEDLLLHATVLGVFPGYCRFFNPKKEVYAYMSVRKSGADDSASKRFTPHSRHTRILMKHLLPRANAQKFLTQASEALEVENWHQINDTYRKDEFQTFGFLNEAAYYGAEDTEKMLKKCGREQLHFFAITANGIKTLGFLEEAADVRVLTSKNVVIKREDGRWISYRLTEMKAQEYYKAVVTCVPFRGCF